MNRAWARKIKESNEWIALHVTMIFGTMWIAYIFFFYGFMPIFFPKYIVQLLYWSNTVQLWSLPLILVGTNLLNKSFNRKINQMHDKIDAMYKMIQEEMQELKDIYYTVCKQREKENGKESS